jgi:hypothetical protein
VKVTLAAPIPVPAGRLLHFPKPAKEQKHVAATDALALEVPLALIVDCRAQIADRRLKIGRLPIDGWR